MKSQIFGDVEKNSKLPFPNEIGIKEPHKNHFASNFDIDYDNDNDDDDIFYEFDPIDPSKIVCEAYCESNEKYSKSNEKSSNHIKILNVILIQVKLLVNAILTD